MNCRNEQPPPTTNDPLLFAGTNRLARPQTPAGLKDETTSKTPTSVAPANK
ncbi:hypothetical protein KY290_027778 [Solanum tuberosum]|uniref:Uncharacterized protein n=1 Tax=Solanum tuberosum TaxID=4113 RepID=A0ABQ7UG02_SOLTU|nr:hypothetical protein KY284_026796 [Solanum tuberosum]KAH0748546.1 hypothetical protein KY290_027778 [Solanum tuberosum]